MTATVCLWRPLSQCPYLVKFRHLSLRSLSDTATQQCSNDGSQENPNVSGRPTRTSTTPKKFAPPDGSTYDWMGPPDRLSNLRPILYHIPDNETELEKQLRHLRQETEDWNHGFWAKQNVTFSKEKEDYIVSQLELQGLSERDETGRKRTLNSEKMAVFYKHFLDTNRVKHANYNKEWYRRNFSITMLMGRVILTNIWRKLSERRSVDMKGKDSPTT